MSVLEMKSPAGGAPTGEAEDDASRLHTTGSGRSPLDTCNILQALFPNAFFVREALRKPLKVGIFTDIIAELGDDAIPRKELSAALRWYTSGAGYLKNLKTGRARCDLNGDFAGKVTREEAAHARFRLIEMSDRQRRRRRKRLPLSPESIAALKAATLERARREEDVS
jgi:sRNA-binding protein